ncbi:MAG TPA: 2-hydroxyacyl-CoA dehydratase family protein [bacterium]|nr:2-hydroxyacyl-CoA dehydratase family protein [bacterium]
MPTEKNENAADANSPSAGWFCGYTPIEILDAAGMTPVRITGERASSGVADSLMHTNICPYVKACLESAAGGKLNFLKGAVFTNGCDAQRRLYDIWLSVVPSVPAFLLTVPRRADDASARAFAARLAEFKAWAEETFATQITDDKLRESIRAYAKLREALAGMDEAREAGLIDMPGSRAMEIYLEAQKMSPAAALEMAQNEVAAAKARAAAGGAPKGPRLLLAGNMTDDPELARMFESYGATVVSDAFCAGSRFSSTAPPDPDIPPLEALARAYLRKSPCPRMVDADDYASRLVRKIEATKPDGVVFHILKFCDAHLYDMPFIRDALRSAGVRTLIIEGDYTSGSGQLATRAQAFLETI